jgi:DNA-directed RNA polymerase alpha subunit
MDKNTHISLKVKISDINISIRTINCLDWLNFRCNYDHCGNYFYGRKKVYTLGDLITYHPKELLKIRNFGKKSLNEIEDVLEEYGLKLGMYIDEPQLAVEDKVVCTICNTEEDEEFTYGYIGLIPVTFCVFCLSGLMDMSEQLNPYESE